MTPEPDPIDAEKLAEARAHHQAGRLAEAERLYRDVLARRPGDAAVLSRLGAALAQQGRLDETVAVLARAIEADPGLVDAHNNLGAALQIQGRLDDAAAAYHAALAIDGDHVSAHVNLGNVLKRQGKSEDAAAAFGRALAVDDTAAGAHNGLGALLLETGNAREAAERFRRAIEIEPTLAEAHGNLGSALRKLDRLDDAVASYRRAIALNPGLAEAHNGLGLLYESLNDLDAAEACIAEALRLRPDDPANVHAWAVVLRRRGRTAEAIEALSPFAAADLPDGIGIKVDNELGRLHDIMENSEAALRHFTAANDRQARSEPAAAHKKETFLAEVDAVERVLGADWVQSWTPGADAGGAPSPAFLVGFPRSGTTLLDQILDSHPAIQVMEERGVLIEVIGHIGRAFGGYPEPLAAFAADDIRDLRRRYHAGVETHLQRRAGTLLVDKYPLNICHVPLIVRLFPDARIILALRHPMDVVLSNFMQAYALNDAMANFFTMADAANAYRRVMGLWRQCEAVLPIASHAVRYESLVTDFRAEVEGLLRFLGLPWDDAVLAYDRHAKARGPIRTPSYQSVTEPIYGRAKGRWKRYGDAMAPVKETLQPLIDAFGYSD